MITVVLANFRVNSAVRQADEQCRRFPDNFQ